MRKFCLLVLFMLLSMAVLPLHAQDNPVWCGELKEADCAILQHAAEVTTALESASLEIKGDLTLVNLPNTPDIQISLAGTGAFDINQKAIQLLPGGLVDDADHPTLTGTLNLLLDLFRNINAELTLNVNLPGIFIGETGVFAPLNRDTVLDVKIVDGTAFLNFDALDTDGGISGWGGINVVEVARLMMIENADLLKRTDDLLGMQTGVRERREATAALITSYLHLKRTDDGSDDEAVFESSFDVISLLANDYIKETMRTEIEQQYPYMSQNDRRQLLMMIPMMFNNSTIKSVRRIDLKTGQTVYISYEFRLDLGMVMVLMGDRTAPKISFKLETALSDFDNVTVSAPRDAQVAPTDMIIGMLTGSRN